MALLAAATGFLLALIFLFVAAYNALNLIVPSWAAALIIAGIAILSCLFFILMARGLARFPRRKSRRNKRDNMESVFAELLGEKVSGFAQDNAFLASFIALLAGLVAGLSPRLRNAILRFLAI